MPQKALGEIAEVDFDTSEENQLSYLQNGYFLKNHWECHEPNNQENAYRKINTISELFIKHKSYSILCTFQVSSLYLQNSILSLTNLTYIWLELPVN